MAFVRTWPGRHIRVIDFENGMATLVSATPTGTPANDRSARPALSRDGQFVAFESRATDLVPDDRNGKTDVFLRDLRLRTTVRVSVSSAGVEGNGPSIQPRLSADGRFVVFSSLARNLVADDRNGAWDVFIHDLANRTTRRVNVSDDGREADGPGLAPDVSGWGDHVTFQSEATNLVPGDGNSWPDVFVGGDHPRLEVEASAPGPALRLFLRSASDATLPYQLAASLGCEPPIRFGSRVLHLAGDSLLLASLRLPGFTGILDAQGRAVANVSLPLELWGQGLLLAYLTMHPGAPYYVRGISNVVRVSTR
jgi:hypothetical protein